MGKKLLRLIAALVLVTHLAACSSSDDEAPGESADSAASAEDVVDEAAGTGDEVVAEGDGAGAEDDLDADATADADLDNDAAAAGDEVTADLGDEDLENLESEMADGNPPAEVAQQDVPPTDPAQVEGTEPPAETSPADTTIADSTPSGDSSAPVEDLSQAQEPVAVAAPASLKKIRETPFEVNGQLLNAVYIARPGENLKAISQKIYGENRRKDLLSGNPHLKNGVKTGDKVYYKSPRHPDEHERLLTYYEDVGIPAQTYTAQEGENIRDVAKNLLGTKDSWKELWATNLALESKGALAGGTEIRYWPDQPAAPAAPSVAQNETPMPQEPAMPPMQEPPMPDIGQTPPDTQDPLAQGTVAPPTQEPNIPPPPPPQTGVKPKKETSQFLGVEMDQDTTFMVAVGGLALVALVLIMAIFRKNRSRRLGETQTQL